MIYTWKDKNTGKVYEIQREVTSSHIEPVRNECADMDEDEYDNSDFIKLITGGAGHIGFGRKGNW